MKIIELQARVWQAHFLKERGKQVPLMKRTFQNLRYYMEKEPEGCLVAESESEIVGTIISHVWGSLGWFGPLEVIDHMQGKGIGKALVGASVQYLQKRGCGTIGLETMTGSVRNIAFYSKLGFEPAGLSYVFFKRLRLDNPVPTSAVKPLEQELGPEKAQQLWRGVMPGLDYSVEFESLGKHGLGEALVFETEHGPAHAILHTYDMFEGSWNAIVKLLVAGQGDLEAAGALLDHCEQSTVEAGKTGLFVRNYSLTPPNAKFFIDRGYELQGTLIRMLCQGEDEEGDGVHVSCMSG